MYPLLNNNPVIGEWSILTAYRGSIAHGMYVPNTDPMSIDDIDLMAVCVPPIDYYFGLKTIGSHGTVEIMSGEFDVVAYEARKFISLLRQGNPNVLALLWLQPEFYLKTSGPGLRLVGYRDAFSGKHVYNSFIGYARGQMHRMVHHEFGGHMGAKRKQLAEIFGFDCKNAAHMIRILRMGIEFLDTGKLNVLRPDADELLRIKRGEWSLEQVTEEANRLFKKAEESLANSKLPDGPDSELIGGICTSIVKLALESR